MSYQNIFHPSHRNTDTSTNKRTNPGFYLASLLLIAAGSWLIIFFLNLSGTNPFSANQQREPLTPVNTFYPSVRYWEDEIYSWAQTWSLDPILIATIIQIESCGDPWVVSPAGAQGLFQVMPYHFAPGEDMLDPQTNAKRGLAYLKQSFDQSNGDLQLTLAGYNGGHGQIPRDMTLWAEETQDYVFWGTGIYQDAISGNPQNNTLNAWLAAGGNSLCNQAAANLNLP